MAQIDKIKKQGLTYDDVLLVPDYSEFLPRKVNIESRFTKNGNCDCARRWYLGFT